jgi:hypothetical protein
MNMQSRNPYAHEYGEERRLTSRQLRQVKWLIIALILLFGVVMSVAQTGLQDLNFQAQSEFQPSIKDAIKFSDLPEIGDSVKRITGLSYPIASVPMFPKYQVQPIEPARMKDEPLNRLYHSLLKVGYGPLYNMPYGELWMGSTRSRENSYGAHFRHLSSSATLKDAGFSGFSENGFDLAGKKFYRKHTLGGLFNFQQNGVHYYGYDANAFSIPRERIRQNYQLIEPRITFTSHHADSSHMNNRVELGFYNLKNLHSEAENNIRFDGTGNLFLNREKLNVGLLADYYNHKQSDDTLNDFILSLSPSFEAGGKKWKADVGITATLDNWDDGARFYFYPLLNVHYDIYESMVIPYAGVTGGLIKNSLRRLSSENPFIDTTLNYQNTDKRYDLFAGLRGNLSSLTSYDAKVSYARYNRLHFYLIDYENSPLFNRFNVLYDDATVLTVTGQLKYQLREKINVAARGNYYMYQTSSLVRAYHRPEYDFTFTTVYNIKSKFILRAELYVMGDQWTLTRADNLSKHKQIPGWADVNLEGEYRYSKMLGFFLRFNNISNQRYYRWERYPVQRLGFMAGLSFVPF